MSRKPNLRKEVSDIEGIKESIHIPIPTPISTHTPPIMTKHKKKDAKPYTTIKDNLRSSLQSIFKRKNKKSSHNLFHDPHHDPHQNPRTYSRHRRQSSKRNNNYISKLIDLYYNNDDVAQKYLDTIDDKIHIHPQQRRIIVIGDIHGDFDAAITCLILAKCIEPIVPPERKTVPAMDAFFNKLKWIGEDTYIVQLGDQIDRVRPQDWNSNDITNDRAYQDEGSTLEIFYLFYYLDILARVANGRVLSIIGNHEIMNVEGDFRYVSLQEFKCFKDHLSSTYHRNSRFPYHSKTLKNNSHRLKDLDNTTIRQASNLPSGYRERLYAFSPTGLCANMMGTNNYTILQIGKWLFCHGSPVLRTFKTYSTEMINNIMSMYLLGLESDDNTVEEYYNDISQSNSKESILWNRKFGDVEVNDDTTTMINNNTSNQDKNNKLTKSLDIILEAYNKKNNPKIPATHIAVGHTPQFQGNMGINSICGGRAWRCDVGMSRAFGKCDQEEEEIRKPQVLEILGEKINIM